MLLLLLTIISFSSDALVLKWQFKQNDTFRYETTSRLTQSVRVKEQEYKQDNVHIAVMKYTVQSVEADGSLKLEQIIESMKATNPDGSASPGNNAIYNQLQGVALTMKLNPKFEVTELEGYDLLLKKLAGDDPSLRRVVHALFSEEHFKQAVHQAFGVVPQKEVPAGFQWNRKSETSIGPLGSVQVNLQMTAVGMKDFESKKLVKITYKPTLVYHPATSEASNPEMSITKGTVQLQESDGIAYFDPKAGRLYHSTLKLKMTGELTGKISGQEVPIRFDQTQTIEMRIK
ncbi:MAG: hypothetical protein JNJ77_16975 [Planctomycetia bacterium]|nr:hypothetical protein [Planctomycetia bacterium]